VHPCRQLYLLVLYVLCFICTNKDYRLQYSTVTAMTEFLNNVITALDNKEHALALFIDVAKTFDSIDHHILFRKLNTYGLRGVVLDWFKDYLSNRFQFIETNYDSSALKSVCNVVCLKVQFLAR
jgi:hypothetical protein